MYGQVNGLRNEGGATCATGDVTYAHVWLGRAIVVVSVAPGLRLAPDDPVWIDFDQARLHLFDGRTEQALAADA